MVLGPSGAVGPHCISASILLRGQYLVALWSIIGTFWCVDAYVIDCSFDSCLPVM